MAAYLWLLVPVLALAARSLYLELDLDGWERLWRLTAGPVAVELCRNAGMARLGNEMRDYPLPREFRTLLLRIGGLPVWSRQSIVGLPDGVDARIGEVGANEFDHLFSGPFRLSWNWRTMHKLYTVHPETRRGASIHAP